MKKRKRKSVNEFRYNYNTKHTNYVFEEDKNKYHALGLTHKAKTLGKVNMPLDSNPKRGRNEKAYIRFGIITDKKNNYSGVDKRFKFSLSDYKNVKSKIRNYKKKRKKRTNIF